MASLTELLDRCHGAGLDAGGQGHVTKVVGLVLGGLAQHEIEGLLDIIKLVAVASLVGQDPGQGDDRIGVVPRGIGGLSGIVGVQADPRQPRCTAGCCGLDKLTGFVLDCGRLKGTLDEGLVQIADGALGILEDRGNTLIPFAAGADGPLDALAGADAL